jgi:hypothetical protein
MPYIQFGPKNWFKRLWWSFWMKRKLKRAMRNTRLRAPFPRNSKPQSDSVKYDLRTPYTGTPHPDQLVDLYISPEALEDMRNWGKDDT